MEVKPWKHHFNIKCLKKWNSEISFHKGIRLKKLWENSKFLETPLDVTAARDKPIEEIT